LRHSSACTASFPRTHRYACVCVCMSLTKQLPYLKFYLLDTFCHHIHTHIYTFSLTLCIHTLTKHKLTHTHTNRSCFRSASSTTSWAKPSKRLSGCASCTAQCRTIPRCVCVCMCVVRGTWCVSCVCVFVCVSGVAFCINYLCLYTHTHTYTHAHTHTHTHTLDQVLSKLGALYNKEQDDTQAFHNFTDSYNVYVRVCLYACVCAYGTSMCV
jgi:hypothetical protein